MKDNWKFLDYDGSYVLGEHWIVNIPRYDMPTWWKIFHNTTLIGETSDLDKAKNLAAEHLERLRKIYSA